MNPKTMKYGPHSDHVEALLVALRDPAIRRRARGPLTSLWDMDAVAQTVYHRLRAAVRLQAWDDARVTAASVATPSHWQAASGAVLVLVASDLISDDAWDRYTDTSLARLISIQRPAGPLSERCPCGHQLGEACSQPGYTEPTTPPGLVWSSGQSATTWCPACQPSPASRSPRASPPRGSATTGTSSYEQHEPWQVRTRSERPSELMSRAAAFATGGGARSHRPALPDEVCAEVRPVPS